MRLRDDADAAVAERLGRHAGRLAAGRPTRRGDASAIEVRAAAAEVAPLQISVTKLLNEPERSDRTARVDVNGAGPGDAARARRGRGAGRRRCPAGAGAAEERGGSGPRPGRVRGRVAGRRARPRLEAGGGAQDRPRRAGGRLGRPPRPAPAGRGKRRRRASGEARRRPLADDGDSPRPSRSPRPARPESRPVTFGYIRPCVRTVGCMNVRVGPERFPASFQTSTRERFNGHWYRQMVLAGEGLSDSSSPTTAGPTSSSTTRTSRAAGFATSRRGRR